LCAACTNSGSTEKPGPKKRRMALAEAQQQQRHKRYAHITDTAHSLPGERDQEEELRQVPAMVMNKCKYGVQHVCKKGCLCNHPQKYPQQQQEWRAAMLVEEGALEGHHQKAFAMEVLFKVKVGCVESASSRYWFIIGIMSSPCDTSDKSPRGRALSKSMNLFA